MMGKTSMTHEEIINYVKEMDRTNQSVHGDWTDNAAAFVSAYWERDAGARLEFLENWIANSEEYKAAWVALTAVASDLKRSGLSLPDSLAWWLAEVVGGKRRRPSKKTMGTYLRDYGLARMVLHLSQLFVVKPTRNDATETLSACDLVADALGYDYKTIVKAYMQHKGSIWNQHLKDGGKIPGTP